MMGGARGSPRRTGDYSISHDTVSHLLLHVVLAVRDQDHLITDEAVLSFAVHGRERDGEHAANSNPF